VNLLSPVKPVGIFLPDFSPPPCSLTGLLQRGPSDHVTSGPPAASKWAYEERQALTDIVKCLAYTPRPPRCRCLSA